MNNDEFRNGDKFQILPHREWIRKQLPPGRDGVVVEDLDLVLRVYGERFNTDATGKFMFVELKYGSALPGIAQKKTFGLIDDLLKKADPEGIRYKGYWVLQYTNENWDVSGFKLNNETITKANLVKFLMFQEFK